MKKDHEQFELLFSILKSTGAIETCPVHDIYYYSTGMDPAAVFASATKKYKEITRSEIVPYALKRHMQYILETSGKDRNCPICRLLSDLK